MNLMISETPLLRIPAATHADVAVDILSYATGECALGRALVARSVDGVCAVLIGADHDELEADLAARFPQATLVANEAVVRDDLTKVIRFVDEPAEGFHLALDMRGTPLQRRVWEKLRAIPNPIAVAIPCHRVVRSDGDLVGYRWGIERKRELIRKEAIALKRRSSAVPNFPAIIAQPVPLQVDRRPFKES